MKLSIITINWNNAEGLRKTMESVMEQSCQEFEYLVVDGGSCDGEEPRRTVFFVLFGGDGARDFRPSNRG